MPGSDDSGPNVLSICIANTDTAIMGTFSSKVTGDVFATEVAHPATSCVLSASVLQLRSINALQANRRAVHYDSVGIAHLDA